MEFDLDAALARKPELLLVDEYAHSNAPGSRHPKRWQDVEELLAAGHRRLDHAQRPAPGKPGRRGLEDHRRARSARRCRTRPSPRADEIELVDITPEELRERLAEGKVYVPETARLAADHFFKPENLTALRELALRRAPRRSTTSWSAPCAARASRGPGRRASGSWC